MKPATARGAERRTGPTGGDPAWDVALLFPRQGEWTEAEYLALESNGENRLVELADGILEVLPMPDVYHQRLVTYLLVQFLAVVPSQYPGEVLTAPLPIWLWLKQLREPDLVYLRPGRIRDPHQPPRGADLVIEVVSPGQKNRERDFETKRRVYAKARIAEYWIVDPAVKTITVLTLGARGYRVHGVFGMGTRVTSKLLAGFGMEVRDVFAAGEGGG